MMNRAARDAYLENEVLTATPQRLRMMLLDGAWRFCIQGREAILAERHEDAERLLERAHQILTEIIAGIRPGYEVSKSIAGIYVFLIRELSMARLNRSANVLNGVIEVLEIERETWRQLCEALPNRVASNAPAPHEILAHDAERILARRTPGRTFPGVGAGTMTASGGSFQLDA